MTPHPPYRLSARSARRGGDVSPARILGGYDPVGFRVLTVFVHGYNNSVERATARWDEDIFPGIRNLVSRPIDGVVLFLWPGDTHPNRLFSSARYPKSITAAVRAGEELAHYLRQAAEMSPGLRVQFVGHSLGCRVVLAAVRELANGPRTVDVDSILLMGAAVPEGECMASGRWPDILAARETVLFSPNDKVLKRLFPLGEGIADPRSPEPLRAVGLTGGPDGRWHGEAEPCALDHDQYPEHPEALRYVARLFGQLEEHPVTTRKPGESHLDERHLDSRPLDTVARRG